MRKMPIAATLLMTAATAQAAEWSLKPLWESPAELKNPESVVYDANHDVLIVSNVNGKPLDKDGNGFLSLVNMDGTIRKLEWATGLNGPKGLAIVGHLVYVADIDTVVAVDTNTGQISSRHVAEGAKFLNDAAKDAQGNVYISDMATNVIWRVDCCTLTKWLESPGLENPNGLHVKGDRMYEGAWGVMAADMSTKVPGRVKVISMKDKSIHDFGGNKPVGNMDGIELLPDGKVLATDWVAGGVMTVSAKGDVKQLVDLPQGSADLTIIPKKKMIIVPMMMDNKLIAYRLQRR